MTRYLFRFMCICALVETLPFSASAQEEEVFSEPAPEESVLQLQVDEAGVEVVPSAPRTGDGYTLEEMELRVKRAKIGLWSTAGATVLGGVVIGASWTCEDSDSFGGLCWGPFLSGVAVGFSGAVGMIVTGALLGARKRKLRRLEDAGYGTPRRVQWDLETSRFVF